MTTPNSADGTTTTPAGQVTDPDPNASTSAQLPTPGRNYRTVASELSQRITPATVAEVRAQVDFSAWGNALVNGTPYDEPIPDYLARTLLLNVLTAATPEQVMTAGGIGKLQQMVPNVPGASTGNLEITDIYVTGSDFGEGMPCYVIVSYVHLEDGTAGKFTTGASYLQAQLLALLNLNQWPIRGKIERIDRKDRGSRYLFQMFPID